MSRLEFESDGNRFFMENVKAKSGLTWERLAACISVSGRTLRDWKNGVTLMSADHAYTLSKQFNTPLPSIIEVKEDYWHIAEAARRGGLKRFEKYGAVGSIADRQKGGRVSQLRRKHYPERYQHCNLPKLIKIPGRTEDLAELFGIILGDGAIGSDYQVTISLHREHDREYSGFVKELIHNLFAIEPAVYFYRSPRSQNVMGVTASSVNLVEFLLRFGLKKGNKTKNQVGVPGWIYKDLILSRSCMRGLIDTDGCVYAHRHRSGRSKFLNVGINFANASQPLLTFVQDILERLGFSPKKTRRGVYLYREEEVKRYACEITFHNEHHERRLKKFLQEKYKREGCAEW